MLPIADNRLRCCGQGLSYSIRAEPGGGLLRTELELEAEGTHNILAERVDVTKQGAGAHTIEWNAPEHEAGLAIDVNALEGNGTYHLEAKIIGTTARLSREVILKRPVFLLMGCNFFDDCTFRYGGLTMRSDGSSFPLEFTPTAGFTYNFTAVLRNATGSAAHLRFAIYPPESISTGDDLRAPAGGN